MKWAYLLFYVLASVTSAEETACKFEKCTCTCCLMVIPDSCDKYCYCSSPKYNTSTEIKCRKGEKFDPEMTLCLPEKEVQCPTYPLTGFNCRELGNGLYSYPGRCEVFIQCSNGIEHILKCPEGLHFSTAHNRCEHQDTAKCDTTIMGKPCEHSHLYPDEYDCSRYYHCSFGKLYPMQCPEDLHWCSSCQRCEYQDEANCVPKRSHLLGRVTAASSAEIPVRVPSKVVHRKFESDNTVGLKCTSPDGVYAVPSEPSMFLRCQGAQGEVYACPPGQVFRQDSNSCITTSSGVVRILNESKCREFQERHFRT